MNEPLTRDLTKDQLSLVSGGEESDQDDSGWNRNIYHNRTMYFDPFRQYDINGDGDGWDELSSIAGGWVVAASAMTFIDKYVMDTGDNQRR